MKNLFLTFLMLAGFSLFADDLYVNSSGLEGTYYTIQEAVDAAEDGDNIYIATVGTFSEDVTVDKTLFLVAAVPDEYFTLSGEIQIETDPGIEVTIIGMNNGSVTGTGQGTVIGDKVIVNVISSFISSIGFHGNNFNYEVNVYDCEVYNDFDIRNGEVKGNTITNLSVQNDPGADTDTVKIMGNYIQDFYFDNDTHYFEICNNFIDGQDEGFTISTRFQIDDWRLIAGGTNLISNNTISSNSYYPNCSNMFMYGIYLSGNTDGQNLVIVNNYIENNVNCGCGNGYEGSYLIYSQDGDMTNAYVANNYYYSNSGSSTTNYEIYNFDSSSLIDNNNTNYDFDSSTGIVNGGQNLGLDWIEYRDIDNTVNDIGPVGGPHAWSNYNTTQGKAAIVDLELPFQLYIGGVHNVKAKSIHKN